MKTYTQDGFSQAKLETLEAIIKEVEGMKRTVNREEIREMFRGGIVGELNDIEVREQSERNEIYNKALSDLLTKLESEIELIKKN